MSHPDYEHIGDPATKAMEECAEVIQEICKARRFGWFNFHPDDPNRVVSAKFPTRADADGFREEFPALDLIEVGWLSYALMRRNLPTLAMLPLWRELSRRTT